MKIIFYRRPRRRSHSHSRRRRCRLFVVVVAADDVLFFSVVDCTVIVYIWFNILF